ncbi:MULTISPECIES: hypothetical protein [Saccharibacillus]|uniref:hypothetical protein n=1 Tax=Saccharibacillus TaxID=456492 RepID=UPI00123BBDFA|nr:hypothetical protein [Saccharibacillus sp. WB 17]MWJ32161.1 hypothetical protein [Saccharibacillus sp. WB 17]
MIEEGNYMLFMDDIYTMGPYLPVSECNREMLLETARVSVHQRRKLVPGKGLDSLDVFQDVVNGIKDSLLYQAKDGEWLWSMPKEVLEKF